MKMVAKCHSKQVTNVTSCHVFISGSMRHVTMSNLQNLKYDSEAGCGTTERNKYLQLSGALLRFSWRGFGSRKTYNQKMSTKLRLASKSDI